MNLRTTLVLLILAGAGAAVWLAGPFVAPRVGLLPKPVDPAGAGSPAVLDDQFARDKVKRITVQVGTEPVVLEQGAGGDWALPGKWPTRRAEAEELVSLITDLHSRFLVVPLPDGADLRPYGLDPAQKPVTVTVEADTKHTLLFGTPEQAEAGPFAKPTYVRVDDKPEVVRLGPDLLEVLRRPREAYQRRQLFPDVERVKLDSAAAQFGPPEATGPTLLPRARVIAFEFTTSPKIDFNNPEPPAAPKLERITLKRLGDAAKPAADLLPQKETTQQIAAEWELIEPVHDHVEPEKLKALLAAIPDLWVESFVPPDANLDALKLRTGLDKPEKTLRVVLAGGDSVVLRIGRISQTKSRPGVAQPPMRPGMPPLPPIPITEEFHYAMLEGQNQVFEIKADKFNDLFVSAAALRDEKLARFASFNVNKIDIRQGDVQIVLEKEKDEKKGDKWHVRQPMQALAETEKINELLDKLSGLEARDKDVIDNANLKEAGFDPPARLSIALALEEEEGEAKTKKKRTVSFSFGKHDEKAKKLNVRVAGRERVNLVADDVLKLAERPPLAYRGRRVLDFDTTNVAAIEVQRDKDKFRLQQTNGDWRLTVPAAARADKTKAAALADDLSRLEAVEYVNDAPKPADLAKAGLDKPTLTAKIAYADGKPEQTLLIGKQREGKTDYFAKLAGGASVFAVKKETRDKLDVNSLDFRPAQLWTFTANDISNVKVTRGGETYELKRDNFEWKIVKPFETKANYDSVLALLEALAAPKLAGYQAHAAANPAEFGLDKPVLQITFTATQKPKEGEKEVSKEKTLIIGKAVEGKPEVYAKLADDPAIFKLPEATKINADKPALDLLDRRLLSLDSHTVTKIERTGAAAMKLTKEGKGWKAESGPVSFPADQPTVDATLRTWEFLQAEKIVEYGANLDQAKYGLNPPADTLTITLDGAAGKTETHVLKLGKTQGVARFARIDDGAAIAELSGKVVGELVHTNLDFADRTLMNFDENDLQAIKRAMKGNDLEVEKKSAWKITKPTEQTADEQTLEEWSKQFAKLRADRVAAYAPADLKPFGLDTPTAVITFALGEKDGKPVQHILKIGDPVDAKEPAGDRFAQAEGSKVVGVLARASAKKLLADAVQYRDKSLVRRLAEPDKVTLERGDRAGANKAVFTKVDGTWKMTAPAAAEAEHADMEEFLNILYKLRAEEFVAEKPDAAKLKEYGLDKPAATWHFFVGDKDILGLLIGKADTTGQRHYAKLASGDMIFLLPTAATQRALAEYRKRSLWSNFDAAQVETLTFSGDNPFTLRKVNGAWQLDGKPDQKINQEAVTDTLGVLANLKAERYIRDKDAPLDVYGLGKPKRIIEAQTGMGQKQVLHLGNAEGGSKRLYAALPGQTAVFVLSEADSAKLDRDAKAFGAK